MSSLRRYEILLPLRFNDGRPVPDEYIGQALDELRDKFDAVSWETQIIHGSWRHEGQVFEDDLLRAWVNVDDTPANRQFFVHFKERLEVKFQQIEISISIIPVDTL